MRHILEGRVCDRPVVREQCKANLNILKVNSFLADVSILSPLDQKTSDFPFSEEIKSEDWLEIG